MSYQSNRGQNNSTQDSAQEYDSQSSYSSTRAQEKQGEKEASKKAFKTAAKGVATYFAPGVGGKVVDAVANTKAGQQIINKGGEALNKIPGMGKAAKKLDDKGAIDAADTAIGAIDGGSVGNGAGASAGAGAGASAGSQAGNTASSAGGAGGVGAQGGTDALSSPSDMGGFNPFSKKNPSKNEQDDSQNNGDDKSEASFEGTGIGKIPVKAAVMFLAPIFVIFLIFVGLLNAITNNFSDYGDALGASGATGGETGGILYSASNPEAQEFYERINNVKLSMQANGKSVDALKIAAVYHILTTNDPNIDYESMTEAKIREIADAMFSGNSYNETVFKENLINNIFPKYLPGTSEKKREQMAEDVFDYIDRYYSFIGLDTSSTCAAIGSCTYEIKGFYIPGSGNITKSMSIKDLKVRLMECGSPYGNGSYTTPIDQDLVSFEDYVAGVAYAEIGDYAPDEAIKAQMIASRSFALARPTGMNNGLGKKLEEENGQWILQISSCVADQVFCNINEGCSYMGGGDGQGGIVRSGKVPGAERTRDPLPEDHKLRSLAASVQGEVLVNNQGNIIQAGYLADVSNAFTSLANQGMNYRQILLQVYGGEVRNYGATDIQKMSCNTGSSGCNNASTGPYASWKQYEGSWTEINLGDSGQTIHQIGCLVTSISMLIAKSGVETNISNFNPGTFVEFLNNNGGFASGGNFVWSSATLAAPSFKYQGQISVSGYTREQKLSKIKELLDQGAYVTAEVKGNTGQHWVAIDAVSGNNVIMMDPGSQSTDLWGQYDWRNTSRLAYYKVN